jgi:putative hemolysin
MANAYEVVRAGSPTEREQAYRLRYDIFVKELGVFTDTRDELETDTLDARATHLILRAGRAVVGTCRVFVGTPALANEQRSFFGLPGEAHYDYAPLREAGLQIAEVSRTSIDPAHRGSRALALLWKAAYRFGRKCGAPHFVSLVQIGRTDSLPDAEIVHESLARRKMLHPRFHLSVRRRERGPSTPRHPLYPGEPRSPRWEPTLPPVVRLYHRFGLRTCGRPVFLQEIGRVGMAMLTGPDTFPASVLDYFETPESAICLD